MASSTRADSSLTHAQCTILRGIAILGIVLHNWTHWLPFAVKENEYTFNINNARRIIQVITHPDDNIIIHILSFFGHYGVPLFIFLSGYGLTRKYENKQTPIQTTPFSFISTHYMKLFRMMIIGFAIFLAIDALTPRTHQYSLQQILAQLAMVNNLLSEPQHNIWPGPYWFFGLMLQLYIIYRLLILNRSNIIIYILIAAACIIQAALPISQYDTLNYLRYNCVGSLMPFSLGILAARHGLPYTNKSISALILLVSIAAVIIGSTNYQTWLLVPIAVITAAISFVRLVPQRLLQPMTWMGSISAALFVIHPAVRKIFLPQQHTTNAYVTLVIYLIVAIIAAWLMRPLMQRRKQ